MTLLLWDYVVPLGTNAGTYQLILQEAVSQFENTHPGVKVKSELFHWSEGDKKLAEALAGGGSVPIPDVYLSPGDTAVYDSARQIPVERYLSREKADYEPVSLAAWTRDEHVWGWPRWVSVRTWAANLKLSATAAQFHERWTQSGWTWTDLLAAAREALKSGGSRAFGPAGDDERPLTGVALPRSTNVGAVLADLATAAGIDGPWDASGNYTWTGPGFLRAAEFLAQLRGERLARMDGDRFGESTFQLFWDGRAAFVAGGGTWLFDRLERGVKLPSPPIPAVPDAMGTGRGPGREPGREPMTTEDRSVAAASGARDVLLALLPVPHPDDFGKSVVPTRTSAYVVFDTGAAGAKRRDQRRIRAAMDLARTLSRYRVQWLSYNLRLWPAYKADLESLGPRAQILSALMPLAAPKRALTIAEAEREKRFLAEVAAPALSRLWRKDLNAAEFVAKLAGEAGKFK